MSDGVGREPQVAGKIPHIQRVRHVPPGVHAGGEAGHEVALLVANGNEERDETGLARQARLSIRRGPDRLVPAQGTALRKAGRPVEREVLERPGGDADRIVDIHPGSSPHRARGGPDAQVPDRSAAGAQLVHQRGDRSQPQIVFARLRVPGGVRAEKPHGVALGMRVPDVTVLVFGDRDFRDIQRSRQRESDRAAERVAVRARRDPANHRAVAPHGLAVIEQRLGGRPRWATQNNRPRIHLTQVSPSSSFLASSEAPLLAT